MDPAARAEPQPCSDALRGLVRAWPDDVARSRPGLDGVAAVDLLRAESQRLTVDLRTVARSVLEQAGRSGLPSTEEGG